MATRLWVDYDGGTTQEREIARIARDAGAAMIATMGGSSKTHFQGGIAVVDAGKSVDTDLLVVRLQEAGFEGIETDAGAS